MSKNDKPIDAARFRKVVQLIKRKGRVKGFEALRDEILLSYEVLTKEMPSYSALKIALEADRHALFAQVAEVRGVTEESKQEYVEFMRYLSGDIDVSPTGPPRKDPSTSALRTLISTVGNGDDPEEDPDDGETQG